MQIDSDLILRLEKLSNLALSPAERERFSNDLGKIVDMVNQLQEINTEGVEPLIYLSEDTSGPRPDVVEGQVTVEEALRNAPATVPPFFEVPKVASKPT